MSKLELYPLSKSWFDFPMIINQELALLKHGSVIVEIGGGANPYLSKEQVLNFRYKVFDIDANELAKANGNHFEKICADITTKNLDLKCDLIISNMLLEHIPNPKEFHKACYKILKNNGKAIHFFATKYSPSSVVNLILPEQWSRQLLYAIQKRKWDTEGKFPAYYRWCIGPTKRQINKFLSKGFVVEKYYGYIGSGYLVNIPILNLLERLYNTIILKIKSPYFCSNSIIFLSKK